MSTFFDKLKKGMEIDDLPKVDENLAKDKPFVKKEMPDLVQKLPTEESSAAFIAAKNKVDKKTTKDKIKKKIEKASKEKKEMKKIKVKMEKTEKEEKAQPKEEKKWFEEEGQLTIDVYQTNNEIVIQSAVAGIKPEDLDISIENDRVSIKGERKKPFEKEEINYFYSECYWGRFSREIILPVEVDSSRAVATMQQGILIIRIPKIESGKKRKIVIEK